MKILITGARGLLGQSITPVLLEKGHELNLIDLSPDPQIDGTTYFQGSFVDKSLCEEAMQGCDVVMHGGAWHDKHRKERTDQEYFDVNVAGTFNLLDLAPKLGVKKFIYASSVNAEWRTNRLYTSTKTCAEEFCRITNHEKKLPFAIMRYWAFSPLDMNDPASVAKYARDILWIRVHVEDVIQATVQAIENDNYDYEVFCVAPDMGYKEGDQEKYEADPEAFIECKFPGSTEVLKKLPDFTYPHTIIPAAIENAQKVLGYQPKHNFASLIDSLKD